jgi:hypothetical protein
MASSSSEAEVAEEDWRIAKLFSVADKATPEEFATLLAEVGTKNAVVHSSMMLNPLIARSHFVVMALLDADEGSLAECIEARKGLLQAAVAAGGAGAGIALVSAMESWVCTEVAEGDAREAAITSFDEALRMLFEWDIVPEEDLRSWQADERAARLLQVSQADAIRIHERGRIFCDWIDQGEGE